MATNDDDLFFERADAHIRLSNEQLSNADRSEVSASMMFATTRYNAWVIAGRVKSGPEMKQSREEMINYFMTQYRLMLEENMDDYIKNFDSYMNVSPDQS